MKSNLINESDRALDCPVTDSVIEADGDCAIDFERPGASRVLLSIPALDSLGDNLFSTSHFDQDSPTVELQSEATSAAVVPLSIPEANRLQSFVQESKQLIVHLAGGSAFWRLFVGSGVAILMGAMTLVLFGSSREELQSDETANLAALLEPVDQGPATQKGTGLPKSAKSQIELTVSSSPQSGPEPAQYDDPFTEANLVSAKVDQAVHFTDRSNPSDRVVIQHVSHTKTTASQPAWLSGTIDIEPDADTAPLKRKHERSRPSNR